MKFADPIAPGQTYAYFVTAVDVAGNESGASNASDTNGAYIDPSFLPQQPGQLPGEDSGEPGTDLPGTDLPGTGLPGTGTDNPGTGNNGGTGTGNGNGGVQKSVPAVPANVSVEPNGVSVLIKWMPNAAADQVKHYNIYFSDTENGNYKKIGTVNGPLASQYFYIGAVFTGFYQVTAVNDKGESPPSAPKQFTQ